MGNYTKYSYNKRHSGAVVSTAASQQAGSGEFVAGAGPFCAEFACSPRVCVGSLSTTG